MPALKAVILGAGMIADIHRRAALLGGAQLVGVMASTPVRSHAVAREWGTQALATLDDLSVLKPDVVHICSPNGLHQQQASAAVAAGAHVICEKPMAIDVSGAERMLAQASEAKRIATVPFVYRFHPLVRELRARAQAGEFGRWQLLHGSYLQDWMISPLASNWRVDAKAGCGFHAIRPPSPLSSGQAFHGHLATCSTAIRPGSRSAATQGGHC